MDSSLFIRKGQLGQVSILLYVDDLVITGADLGEIDRVKLQLAASFNMKDIGDLHYFLGIEVIRTPEGILISQHHYVLCMLFKFGMADCKSVSTPLDRTVKLCPDAGKVCDRRAFRQIVRSLIYLTITRTDLNYPVGVISQFMARPTEEHLQCAQHVLRYVSNTKDRGLLYRNGTDAQLVGNDADRRSTSGYAFSLWSAAIAWSSKKQPREQERSGRDHNTELDDEFDFRSAEEAECGSTEESESDVRERKSRRQPSIGEMTPSRVETANSDERENKSEVALKQPRPMQKRRQQKKRQYRDNEGAEKGSVSRQADHKGRSARS